MSKMDRKKCRRIVKNVSSLPLVQISEVLEEEITREKKAWLRKWLARRSAHGGSALLLKELHAEDPAEYRACLRMSPECFDTLHDPIANAIQRSDTLMRDAIPSRIKLEVTLSFLSTGNNYKVWVSRILGVDKPGSRIHFRILS
jgi:hypothetical protein